MERDDSFLAAGCMAVSLRLGHGRWRHLSAGVWEGGQRVSTRRTGITAELSGAPLFFPVPLGPSTSKNREDLLTCPQGQGEQGPSCGTGVALALLVCLCMSLCACMCVCERHLCISSSVRICMQALWSWVSRFSAGPRWRKSHSLLPESLSLPPYSSCLPTVSNSFFALEIAKSWR